MGKISLSKVLKGPKISSKHSSFTTVAGKVIIHIKGDPMIKKIILGQIYPASASGLQRAKALVDNGQIRINCRGGNTFQKIYVVGYFETPQEALTHIQNLLKTLRF